MKPPVIYKLTKRFLYTNLHRRTVYFDKHENYIKRHKQLSELTLSCSKINRKIAAATATFLPCFLETFLNLMIKEINYLNSDGSLPVSFLMFSSTNFSPSFANSKSRCNDATVAILSFQRLFPYMKPR